MKKFWAVITILTMFWGVWDIFSDKVMKVEQVWARAVPAGSPSAMVFLTVNNKTSEGDNIFAASSKVADNVTIQETAVENGLESVHELKTLPLAAGETKVLKPHGVYLLLTGLQKGLVQGDSVPITLNFTKAGLVETKAHVEAPNAMLYDNF